MNIELLQRLAEAPGVPGREDPVRKIVIDELTPLVDTLKTDFLGNVIALKKGAQDDARRVMLSAHMDEIGFFVSAIDKDGFLRLSPVGGFDPRTLMAQRVYVHGKKTLLGVIGSKPIHILNEEERKKIVEIRDLFVDLGLPEKAVSGLVEVGDPVNLEQQFAEVGDTYCCKSFDDRVGLFILIEALKRLRGKRHEVDIYCVASAQEEVGLRGARISSYGIDPQVGIALDVTIACDVPESKPHQHVTRLGEGVAIKIKDSASISNPKLVRQLRDLARKKKVRYQLEILPRGGTDAGVIQATRAGVATATLSIPTRYCHSVVEMVHRKDIESTIRLLVAYLQAAHEGDYRL
jgi:endoglucanase